MKKEKLNQSNLTCWIFDVDGVITNPVEKKVTEEGLIGAIAEKIEKGDIVTLNTGRSISWIEERVISKIEQAVKDKKKLENFLGVGEKGGDWISYDGDWVTSKDEKITVSEQLKDQIRNLVSSEFSDSMFYDESKLTMISVEMIDGHDLDDFTKRQEELVVKFKEILANKIDLTIDPTTIATDIQNKEAGKHLGARRILNWLKEKGIKPDEIVAVGDSQSDTEMVEETQGILPTRFIFVGDPSKLNTTKLNNPPIFTSKRYGEGTLEYLHKS